MFIDNNVMNFACAICGWFGVLVAFARMDPGRGGDVTSKAIPKAFVKAILLSDVRATTGGTPAYLSYN